MFCDIASISISADETDLYTEIEPQKITDPDTGETHYKISSDDVVMVNDMAVEDFGRALGLIAGTAAIALVGIGIAAGIFLGMRIGRKEDKR